MGEAGIQNAGGLATIAGKYGVTHNSLRNYIRSDGILAERGKAKVDEAN